MRSWAEKMIVREVQEESRIEQEKVSLRNKIFQEKKQEANISAMRLFLNRHINNEWFWNFIAYTYFVCKTLGLLLLIDVLIFRRPTMMLFALVFLCFYFLNIKLYKLYPNLLRGLDNVRTYFVTL